MANNPPAIAATAPLNRNTEISSPALEIPVASAATSASRTATSERPKRLCAMFACHPGAQCRRNQAEEVEPHGGVERLRQDRAGHADAAAGHALPGQRDLRDDRGEAERGHREVEGAQPQCGQADDDAGDGADNARSRQRRQAPAMPDRDSRRPGRWRYRRPASAARRSRWRAGRRNRRQGSTRRPAPNRLPRACRSASSSRWRQMAAGSREPSSDQRTARSHAAQPKSRHGCLAWRCRSIR